MMKTQTIYRKITPILLSFMLFIVFLAGGCSFPTPSTEVLETPTPVSDADDADLLYEEKEYEKALLVLLESNPETLQQDSTKKKIRSISERIATAQHHLQNSISAWIEGDIAGAKEEIAAGLRIYPHHQESLLMQQALNALPSQEETRSQPAQTVAQPSQVEVKMADTYFQSGRKSFERGKPGEAKSLWRMGLNISPSHEQIRDSLANLLTNEGLLLFGKGKIEIAMNHWQEALALTPDNPKIRQYLEKAQKSMRQIESIN